jgi:hypothetical protein
MIKKAGLPKAYYEYINIDSFVQQAQEFEENLSDIMDQAVKFLSIRSAEFPWLVVRAGLLKKWYDSEEYATIIEKYKIR